MSELIISSEQDEMLAIVQKQDEYRKYIEEHIFNVNVAYSKLFASAEYNLPLEIPHDDKTEYDTVTSKRIINEVKNHVFNHDVSKFEDIEFFPYRKKFHPTEFEKRDTTEEEQREIDENFEIAWKHHYTHNSHHPKFFCYTNIIDRDGFGVPTNYEILDERRAAQPMCMVDIIHMICDWEAMGMKFGGSTIDWYINKAKDERSYMHPLTRDAVEKLLSMVYNTTLPSKEEIDRKDKEEGK